MAVKASLNLSSGVVRVEVCNGRIDQDIQSGLEVQKNSHYIESDQST